MDTQASTRRELLKLAYCESLGRTCPALSEIIEAADTSNQAEQLLSLVKVSDTVSKLERIKNTSARTVFASVDFIGVKLMSDPAVGDFCQAEDDMPCEVLTRFSTKIATTAGKIILTPMAVSASITNRNNERNQ